MARAHTQINLADVDDAAPGNGFGARWEARVARDDLEAEQTGLTYFRLRPGKRSPFAHRHRNAEEVYLILGGTGRVKLDDEISEVRPLDAIRVAPTRHERSRPAPRAWSSSPSALIASPTANPSTTPGWSDLSGERWGERLMTASASLISLVSHPTSGGESNAQGLERERRAGR
jgi:quercetin dioxygenase-like cupin family protein